MVSTPALPAEQKLQPTTIQVAKSGQNTYIKPILGRRYVPQDFGNHYQFEPKETTRLRATNQQTNTAAANTAATPFTHNLKSSSSASHFQVWASTEGLIVIFKGFFASEHFSGQREGAKLGQGGALRN